jgi:dATP pyrophosphohydrolase
MEIKSTLVEAHIFRQQGNDIEFLLIKRAENDKIYPGLWQMVTGSIDENEKAYSTALREIKEETGLTPRNLWVIPNVNNFYNPSNDTVNLIPVFAALVDSESNIKLSEEHSDFKWVYKEEAVKILPWKGQRNSVETIHEYFTKEMQNLNLVEIKIARQ